MKKLLFSFLTMATLSMMLTSCSYSVSMQHSVGSTDTLDEAQTTSPNVSPTVTVPLTPGSSIGITK